jgi:hypothetical protein
MQFGLFDGSRRSHFFQGVDSPPRVRLTSRRPSAREFHGMVMYLRFVVTHIDEDSERMVGVFHAVWDLRVRGLLYPDEEDQHDALRHWFSWWLRRPTRFTVAKPPYWRKKNKAICWFRDSAETHIWQIWGMVAILQDHGVPVHMLKAKRVGYVVYEDEYQVAAVPFAETRC